MDIPIIIKKKNLFSNKTSKSQVSKSQVSKSQVSKSQVSKSYSNLINNLLTSVKSETYVNIFGCDDEKKILKMNQTNKNTIKVKIDKCMSNKTKKVKRILKSNLKKKVDCNNLMGPSQKLSNCWFNTLFVSFFLSDKGRKFTKYLRHLMINGSKKDGTLIKPKSLRNSLFLLNMTIEACINYEGVHNKIAKKINTNTIIKNIYNSIPKKDIDIYNVNEGGNPIDYYISIMNFLNYEKNSIKFIETTIDYNMLSNENKLYDIIIVSYYDNPTQYLLSCEDKKYDKIHITDRKGIKHKYVLDSTIVRDITGEHFSSTLMCNNKQLGYDGESTNRLNNEFKWKQYINKDKNWTFEGSKWSNYKGNIYWNYKKSYSIFIYYRIN